VGDQHASGVADDVIDDRPPTAQHDGRQPQPGGDGPRGRRLDIAEGGEVGHESIGHLRHEASGRRLVTEGEHQLVRTGEPHTCSGTRLAEQSASSLIGAHADVSRTVLRHAERQGGLGAGVDRRGAGLDPDGMGLGQERQRGYPRAGGAGRGSISRSGIHRGSADLTRPFPGAGRSITGGLALLKGLTLQPVGQ